MPTLVLPVQSLTYTDLLRTAFWTLWWLALLLGMCLLLDEFAPGFLSSIYGEIRFHQRHDIKETVEVLSLIAIGSFIGLSVILRQRRLVQWGLIPLLVWLAYIAIPRY